MLSFNFHESLALLSTLIVLYLPEKIFFIPLELVKKIAKNRQKICKIWLRDPHFWIIGAPPKYEYGGFETTKDAVESIISILSVMIFFVKCDVQRPLLITFCFIGLTYDNCFYLCLIRNCSYVNRDTRSPLKSVGFVFWGAPKNSKMWVTEPYFAHFLPIFRNFLHKFELHE